MKKESVNSKYVEVKQVRSAIGRDQRFRATLSSIGLGKIGNKAKLPLNSSILGVLKKISHIVEVKDLV
ncbi:MAG TPA: 50S ribosomal protein L30 [Oligoflexia bacterium]|nr:50S ribosomal protein L30 [Oligoflexia bacterium]HMP26481.1 50S ribosomal protein L30 [Oligoflexia bacterium]